MGRLDQGHGGGTFVMVPNSRSCPHIWSYYTVHFLGSKDLSFVLAIFFAGFNLIQNYNDTRSPLLCHVTLQNFRELNKCSSNFGV